MISAQNTTAAMPANAAAHKETTIFSIPIGRLGLISRLMISGACGFIAFFVAFIFGIIGMVIYDSNAGKSMDNLNHAYLYIAAPVGIAVMLAALAYLIGGWARRKLSSGD